MSENAISTGIMSTASIITTIIIVTAAFTVAVAIGASIQDNGNNMVEQLNLDIDIIGVGDIHEGNETYTVYLKNVGADTISTLYQLDVIMDGDYYTFGSVDTTDFRWNATLVSDINGNGNWDPMETVALLLSRPSGDPIDAGSHRLIISVAGSPEDYLFSI